MLSFAEFCAGIGGFRLGLERIGWNCVFSCEIDDQCENTYEANFQTGFNEYDIADIRPSELPYFDVLCAGFPCQSFSIAGKRLGFDDRRGNIIFYLLEIIKFVQPPIILLENVPNFASHNNGSTLRTLKDELRSMGYSVSFATLDSSFFDIPQQRKRLYIVGFHQDTNNAFSFMRKRTESIPFRPFIEYGDYSIPISNKWQEYIDLYTGRKTLDQISFSVPKTRTALEGI